MAGVQRGPLGPKNAQFRVPIKSTEFYSPMPLPTQATHPPTPRGHSGSPFEPFLTSCVRIRRIYAPEIKRVRLDLPRILSIAELLWPLQVPLLAGIPNCSCQEAYDSREMPQLYRDLMNCSMSSCKLDMVDCVGEKPDRSTGTPHDPPQPSVILHDPP